MKLGLSEEQTMLQDLVARYLAGRHGFDVRQAIARSGEGYSTTMWGEFATELGILGAALPEVVGGLGGGPVETLVIARELGRALVSSPYLATVVLVANMLRRAGGPQGAQLLGKIVRGELIAAFCDGAGRVSAARFADGGFALDGQACLAFAAPWSKMLVVDAVSDAGEALLFVVPATSDGVDLQSYATIDGGRAADVAFAGVRLEASALLASGDDALEAVENAKDDATLALCGEACGVLRKLLDHSLAYARDRHQFGRPIGSFQVIQHRLVDMFVEVEQADAASMMAATQASASPADCSAAISAAKVVVGEACRKVGQAAIQIHGGIGMTEELAVGHYFRRATMIEKQFGSVEDHLRRFAQLAA